MLAQWGMGPTAARVYGFLVIRPEPTALDTICELLDLSKSHASVATRQLEGWSLATRHRERGSKRALYTASDDFAALMADHARLLLRFSELFDARAARVAEGSVHARMDRMSSFYRSMGESMNRPIEELRRRTERERAGRARKSRGTTAES